MAGWHQWEFGRASTECCIWWRIAASQSRGNCEALTLNLSSLDRDTEQRGQKAVHWQLWIERSKNSGRRWRHIIAKRTSSAGGDFWRNLWMLKNQKVSGWRTSCWTSFLMMSSWYLDMFGHFSGFRMATTRTHIWNRALNLREENKLRYSKLNEPYHRKLKTWHVSFSLLWLQPQLQGCMVPQPMSFVGIWPYDQRKIPTGSIWITKACVLAILQNSKLRCVIRKQCLFNIKSNGLNFSPIHSAGCTMSLLRATVLGSPSVRGM